ncbi:hypothetical protein AVEN_46429-1 [Araneus ventricosus]|uniref:Reverse transcriptase Ty1/copia-type domain-containing protein n=1 Tax=Araneus ventricosus TaxID=182803 RepID=A0A4Y2QJ99_ARAVE|nr:hypothetical protein AVEN_46429-1 [Araneus ventricosus]
MIKKKNINFDPKEFDFSTERELEDLTDEDLSEESNEEEHSAMVTEIPKSYREVITSSLKDKRINAMETEIAILKDRDVWEIIPHPLNRTVIGCRWVSIYIKEKSMCVRFLVLYARPHRSTFNDQIWHIDELTQERELML